MAKDKIHELLKDVQPLDILIAMSGNAVINGKKIKQVV